MQINKVNINDIDLIISDLDGVLYRGKNPIITAIEFIKGFQSKGNIVTFLTNNSTKTIKEYTKRINNLGIKCEKDHIYSSSIITAKVIAKRYPKGSVFIIGEKGIFEAIEDVKLNIINSKYSYEEIIEGNITCDIVISGLDRDISYNKLSAAVQLIYRGAKYFSTNLDSNFPAPYGLIPGSGAIASFIATASNIKNVTSFGKPDPIGIEMILQKYKIDKTRVVMIGDRLDTDIAAANRAGIKSILVLTGVTNKEYLKKLGKSITPDIVVDNLSNLS